MFGLSERSFKLINIILVMFVPIILIFIFQGVFIAIKNIKNKFIKRR
ncbi:hypothetical protein TEGL_01930 [Terrisporobacter glycolicus ATCC 14880 = DSM 1288]|uniref:Uncharacterized protein n=1 Tax=Terrisporobacter glycolicus ATCC 14880 = DSM 1288 TaxID=1121315 RepID=A0ABZ2EQG9_9FIRM